MLRTRLPVVKVVSSRYIRCMSDGTDGRVVALLERLGRLVAHEGHALDLRPVQWEALRYLDRANRFSRTPSALTAYLGSTKGTVSQTLAALERRGLIRKRPSSTDGRAVSLALTARGRRALERDPLEAMRDAVAGLDPAERDRLASGLDAVLRARLAATDRRAFGICRSCRHFERDAPDGAPHRCALLRVALSDDDASRICVEQEAAAR